MILFSFLFRGWTVARFSLTNKSSLTKAAGNIWDQLQPAGICYFILDAGRSDWRSDVPGFGCVSGAPAQMTGGEGCLWRSRLINRVVLPGAEVQGGVTQYKTCQIQSSAAVGHFVLPDWSPVISCCTRISSPAFIKPGDIKVEKNRAVSETVISLLFYLCSCAI